ncbi:Smr domain-containing protein [Balneicella halophila]|uniref:Smr domain-containing protein n=1 Tax=Balneicella halophila TaxID=1537566 RepID=A0A7L4UMR3_BALHA|nr:Smr/MutS family protein [Balneicella halophila]PVX49911.1 Smr domain-containing protein [Balneicella halophila]
MALQIGDKVKFLNEEGGGKITQLIDKDTVMVLSEIDDFEIPVLIRELIPLQSNESVDNQEVKNLESHKRISKVEPSSVLFAEEKDYYNCYLYNGKSTTLVCAVFEEIGEKIEGIFSGMIAPDSIQKIGSYSLKDFDRISQWRLHGFYFEKHPDTLQAPINCVVKLHSKKLFNEGSKIFIEKLNQKAISVPIEGKAKEVKLTANDLFESVPELAKPKEEKVVRKDTRELLEVDLHIHQLLDTTQGMTNAEMLEYQLDTFRKVLDENKKYKGKKIVFIHGVGNGVLKQRIRHELQKQPRYMVQDASFQEYGWGATMVIIR